MKMKTVEDAVKAFRDYNNLTASDIANAKVMVALDVDGTEVALKVKRIGFWDGKKPVVYLEAEYCSPVVAAMIKRQAQEDDDKVAPLFSVQVENNRPEYEGDSLSDATDAFNAVVTAMMEGMYKGGSHEIVVLTKNGNDTDIRFDPEGE